MSTHFMNWFKSRAEFFKEGAIVPQRILKGSRKHKHHVVFGSPSWAVPTPHGYLVAVDRNHGSSLMNVCGYPFRKFTLTGAPYSPGNTHWVTNFTQTNQEWSDALKLAYTEAFSENAVPPAKAKRLLVRGKKK
ncbi:hypothetical protein D3C77_365950 [compost metagenome]